MESMGGSKVWQVATHYSIRTYKADKLISANSRQILYIQKAIQKDNYLSDSAAANVLFAWGAHPRGTIKVNWPTENAAAYATFFRDLLR